MLNLDKVLESYGLNPNDTYSILKCMAVNNLEPGYFSLLPGLYAESQYVARDRRCFGFIAINKKTADVQVNNILLFGSIVPGTSGESFAIVDPLGRYYNEDFQITFTSGGTQMVQLVQILKIKIE